MTARPQSSGLPNVGQDVANLGLVRPPLVYLTSLVTGALISDFARHRGADTSRHAIPTPSWIAGCAAGRVPCRGCHSAVLLLGCQIPRSRHTRTRPKANDRDRPDGSLSLQPESDLSGVLTVTAWYRDLGQQPVAVGHARWCGGAHSLRRHTQRRAVPGTKIRCPVLELQGLRAPMAVSHPTSGWSGPAHEGRVTSRTPYCAGRSAVRSAAGP